MVFPAAIASRSSRAGALCLALLCGCSEVTSPGLYQLELYDHPVRCNAAEATCLDDDGSSAALEQLSGPAFVSRDASQHGDGLYVFLELQRPSGVRGLLELDVPADGAGGEVQVSYVEQELERVRFRSASARGSISLAPGGCPCSDGQLELELVDAGADGVLGSADDQLRRLSRGQFGPQGAFCRGPRLQPIADGLQVLRLGCPTPARAAGGNGAPAVYDTGTHVELGCGVQEPPPEVYEEEGGCGGDPPPEPEPASGCDAEPEESWDDGGGCEADGGGAEGCEGDSGGGGGCEGDGGGADGCEGSGDACAADAHAAAGTSRRRGRSSRRSVALPRFGVTLPFILPALLLTFLHRRGRRARRRPRARAAASP